MWSNCTAVDCRRGQVIKSTENILLFTHTLHTKRDTRAYFHTSFCYRRTSPSLSDLSTETSCKLEEHTTFTQSSISPQLLCSWHPLPVWSPPGSVTVVCLHAQARWRHIKFCRLFHCCVLLLTIMPNSALTVPGDTATCGCQKMSINMDEMKTDHSYNMNEPLGAFLWTNQNNCHQINICVFWTNISSDKTQRGQETLLLDKTQ